MIADEIAPLRGRASRSCNVVNRAGGRPRERRAAARDRRRHGQLPRGPVRAGRRRRWRSASASTRTAELPGVPGLAGVRHRRRTGALICECIREALARAGVAADAVSAVSATSMREGMVLYDARGREIWACPNVDSRAGDEAAELVAVGRGAGDLRARRRLGLDHRAGALPAGSRATSPRCSPRSPTSACSATGSCTRLSGEFVTDPSLGSSSGMFDLAERDWSDRVLELCGLDRAVFPPVVDSGTVVGDGHGAGGRGRPACAQGRRSSSAAPTPSSACSASASREPGPLHRRRRQLLAAHGRPRRAADRPGGAPADALPHGARTAG